MKKILTAALALSMLVGAGSAFARAADMDGPWTCDVINTNGGKTMYCTNDLGQFWIFPL